LWWVLSDFMLVDLMAAGRSRETGRSAPEARSSDKFLRYPAIAWRPHLCVATADLVMTPEAGMKST
jgi:hypothetical protein